MRGAGTKGVLRAGGGGWTMQQRHGWLLNDNQVIYRAWKCLLLPADFDIRWAV